MRGSINNQEIGNTINILHNTFANYSFYIPIIWLAIFASKRRSENERLRREYEHKETLARTYIGYKTQIQNLNETDEALMKKLLDSSIDTIAYNASKSLDKKHDESTPIIELIKKTLDKLNPKKNDN